MNTQKPIHPERPFHKETVRHGPGRWAAGLMVAAVLGCGPAQNHRSTITIAEGRSVPVIILDRSQSDISIANMRNYISALSEILEKMVSHTVDAARLCGRQPFEGALNAIQAARTAQEVAEEFVERCNSALISEEVSPEEMEFITSRYAFAHGLLADAIIKFRDGLGNGSSRNMPASLGYPQIDLYGEF